MFKSSNDGVYPDVKYCNTLIGSGDLKTAKCLLCGSGRILNESNTGCFK